MRVRSVQKGGPREWMSLQNTPQKIQAPPAAAGRPSSQKHQPARAIVNNPGRKSWVSQKNDLVPARAPGLPPR